MRPRLHDADEDDAPDAPDARDELLEPAPVAYRVSGDAQVRAAELELKVAEMKREMRSLEREVYAARKAVRARKALQATSVGGLGALAGTILGAIIHAAADSPNAIVVATVLGFLFGLLGGASWDPPDDKFPPAPPPRFQ